jgi:hypothetical protein
MQCWVLWNRKEGPLRVYSDKQRADEDFSLMPDDEGWDVVETYIYASPSPIEN